ncbi:hypothetical protein Vretifemale_18114 [Volvox reticuliferus]|uniref:Uncharacterized protein n=1 Tax=Volvox reticuliferus TaxID=1737510 RepID=A0A8J4FU57_9CHLO|nr:hypothetical protein Vretifemale_18114 [Volvox reticuliferus]
MSITGGAGEQPPAPRTVRRFSSVAERTAAATAELSSSSATTASSFVVVVDLSVRGSSRGAAPVGVAATWTDCTTTVAVDAAAAEAVAVAEAEVSLPKKLRNKLVTGERAEAGVLGSLVLPGVDVLPPPL